MLLTRPHITALYQLTSFLVASSVWYFAGTPAASSSRSFLARTASTAALSASSAACADPKPSHPLALIAALL